jgi:hypothetical protein
MRSRLLDRIGCGRMEVLISVTKATRLLITSSEKFYLRASQLALMFVQSEHRVRESELPICRCRTYLVRIGQ